MISALQSISKGLVNNGLNLIQCLLVQRTHKIPVNHVPVGFYITPAHVLIVEVVGMSSDLHTVLALVPSTSLEQNSIASLFENFEGLPPGIKQSLKGCCSTV